MVDLNYINVSKTASITLGMHIKTVFTDIYTRVTVRLYTHKVYIRLNISNTGVHIYILTHTAQMTVSTSLIIKRSVYTHTYIHMYSILN